MNDDARARLREAERADIALLAPVPAMHLASGLETCRKVGAVAYGSNDGMTLSKLKAILDGTHCFVLIYPSLGPGGVPTASWRAVYRGLEEPKAGFHPNPRLRPVTTHDDTRWLLFWEVTDLKKLASEDAIPIRKLRAAGAKRTLAATFIPHGPLIIDNPY